MTIGHLGDREVALALTGVGKVRAAMTAQHVIDSVRPSAIIFTGLAGALAPHLEIGDLVIAKDCVQHDLDARDLGFKLGEVPYTGLRFFPSDPRLVEIASRFRPTTGCLYLGRVLTGDQFVTHEHQQRHAGAFRELAGDAVEMEGASVAQVAFMHQVPMLLARTISDRADGTAAVNFQEFLPRASHTSFELVQFLLRSW